MYAHKNDIFLCAYMLGMPVSRPRFGVITSRYKVPDRRVCRFFAVVAVEFDEGADGAVADLELVEQFGDVVFSCTDTGKTRRHADHFQKGPECADAVAGSDVGMLVVHVTAPDAHGNLGQSG